MLTSSFWAGVLSAALALAGVALGRFVARANERRRLRDAQIDRALAAAFDASAAAAARAEQEAPRPVPEPPAGMPRLPVELVADHRDMPLFPPPDRDMNEAAGYGVAWALHVSSVRWGIRDASVLPTGRVAAEHSRPAPAENRRAH